MPKHAIFTMKLETELRDQFMAEALAAHRPASQIVRELMREFVQNSTNPVSTRPSCNRKSCWLEPP